MKLEEKPINEFRIHKDKKWWITKKYFDKGFPVSKIEFVDNRQKEIVSRYSIRKTL